jgi:hypothetical protein
VIYLGDGHGESRREQRSVGPVARAAGRGTTSREWSEVRGVDATFVEGHGGREGFFVVAVAVAIVG